MSTEDRPSKTEGSRAFSESKRVINLLEHEQARRIIGEEPPRINSYNCLPKEQQLSLVKIEDAKGSIIAMLKPPGRKLRQHHLLVWLAETPPVYGYESQTDGEFKRFTSYLVMDTQLEQDDHPLVRRGVVLCIKSEDPTVRFIKTPSIASESPQEILTELWQNWGEKAPEPVPPSTETYEQLIERLKAEQQQSRGL